MKLSKLFLITSVVLGISGWTSIAGDFGYGVLRPLSAVFFILGLASTLLEAAVQDHEQQTQSATRPTPIRASSISSHIQPIGAH